MSIDISKIFALRDNWNLNKDARAILNKLKITIVDNSEERFERDRVDRERMEIARIEQEKRDYERLRKKEAQALARIEQEQEKLEYERLRKQEAQALERKEKIDRINKAKREKAQTEYDQSQEYVQSQTITPVKHKAKYGMVKEINDRGITDMCGVIIEIHKIVKTKIIDNTCLADPDIARALHDCRSTVADISRNMVGNSALRSELVLNIYNNQ